jgi:hypothetical protein
MSARVLLFALLLSGCCPNTIPVPEKHAATAPIADDWAWRVNNKPEHSNIEYWFEHQNGVACAGIGKDHLSRTWCPGLASGEISPCFPTQLEAMHYVERMCSQPGVL